MKTHLYFSGIGGTGLSALAHLALDCGYIVSGSDNQESQNVTDLRSRGCNINIGQSLEEIKALYEVSKIDELIITSALPHDHPHLLFAKDNNIKVSKRHELINQILKEKNLRLIAIAGTHGKTTTTGLAVWVFKQLQIPISYLIGTNVSYGRSGEFAFGSQYFIYECDEFDRNFLNFTPYISLIPSLDYDHPDTYPTQKDYMESFVQFFDQSQNVLAWQDVETNINTVLNLTNMSLKNMLKDKEIYFLDEKAENNQMYYQDANWVKLPGIHLRKNATLVIVMLAMFFKEVDQNKVFKALAEFPGTERRFEKVGPNLYSDYAHHPTEIRATIQLARELLIDGQKLVIVYQPHQNIRQHQKDIQDGYKTCFELVDEVIWLPTYLSREYSDLAILTSQEILSLSGLENDPKFIIGDFDIATSVRIKNHLGKGDLVLCMGAGSIDNWVRQLNPGVL
jgi:UDP-N-acetylmuramate--alanine ligase